MTKAGRLCVVVGLGLSLAVALLCLFESQHPIARAADLTVCTDGPPICAHGSIQAAVDAANEGDVIKVAAGVYTGVHARSAPAGYFGPSVITQVVYISKSITLCGGYAITNWNHSNPVSYPTILDAQGQGRGIVIGRDRATRPEQAISVTLEGVQVTGGDASGLGGHDRWRLPGRSSNRPELEAAGGGLYVLTATVTISNSKVYSNYAQAGAGIYADSSHATLEGNHVYSNTSGYGRVGGMLALESTITLTNNSVRANRDAGLYACRGRATLVGNTIAENTNGSRGGGIKLFGVAAYLKSNDVTSNTADYGGGLYIDQGAVQLISNIIDHNAAVAGGGGGLVLNQGTTTLTGNVIAANFSSREGGGILNWSSVVTTTGNRFVSNSTPGFGGAFANVGSKEEVTISGNTFVSNSAKYGGALYGPFDRITENVFCCNSAQYGGVAHISANRLAQNSFISNTAQHGGALYGVNRTLEANLFTANTAERGGAWYYFYGQVTSTNDVIVDNQASVAGGGVYAEQTSIHLVHATIAGNESVDGSGVYVTGTASITLTNTILADHATGITVATGSTATLDGLLWDGTGVRTGGGGVISITHAITGAPAFDGDGYHLTSASAAINAGVQSGTAIDRDGQPRDAWPDLGADEFVCAPLDSIALAGPLTGTVGMGMMFTATVAPTPTTLPLRYVWQATGKRPVVYRIADIRDTVTFTWTQAGPKALMVTATNVCSTSVREALNLEIKSPIRYLYLPMVFRGD